MIPRGRLDIGWSDLAYGLLACGAPGSRRRMERSVEDLAAGRDTLVCLSIRSGLDLLLTVLDYPKGSEILVSAVTIRNMVNVIEHHGLVAVPVDVDMETLSVKEESLRRALSPRSKAILVAHLFGSRMDLSCLGDFARKNDLLLIEDCAQSFTGDGYWGHPASDVSLSSFGPLKTATALGAAVGVFKDPSLLARVRAVQSQHPVQGRWRFLKRVCRFGFLRFMMYPAPFALFHAACSLMGKNHDDVFSQSVRGFTGERFFWSIRHQPSYPLLALLAHRIRTFGAKQIGARIASAEAGDRMMPHVRRPGGRATNCTHWVFPILDERPDDLARHLWKNGFDATRGRWSLYVVQAPDGLDHLQADEANAVMSRVVYAPVYPAVPRRHVRRLGNLIREFQKNGVPGD